MWNKGITVVLTVAAMMILIGCGNSASIEKMDNMESVEPVVEATGSEAISDTEKEASTEEQPSEEMLIDEEETAEAEEASEEDQDEAEKEISYGYIEKMILSEHEEIIKKLKDWLEEYPDIVDNQSDLLVDYIIDDFDGDGELEGVACTTPAYNRDSVEEGWYDGLYPATLWGYDKGEDGKEGWLSDLFYEKADGFVSMKEAYIQPGIKVLEIDYFASAHDVNSVFYIMDNENSRTIGSFDNGYVTDKGVITSDHNGYIYNPERDEFEKTDVY